MSGVIERLDWWAANLPMTDPLPIGESEKDEFIRALVPQAITRRPLIKKLYADLDARTLLYRGHKVVVL